MSEANKRKRGNNSKVISTSKDLQDLLSSAITTYKSVEMAVLHLMDKYAFSPDSLRDALLDQGFDVSFSRVKYHQVAPFVGLEPAKQLFDIGTFELHRSRIPTDLFKSIIKDMDLLLMQYRSLGRRDTEEATSRFLSPIFNRLIGEFGFAFRNAPESIIKGRISMNGRIEYYLRAFGSVSILVMELKLRGGGDAERLDAIAQVAAECNTCNYNNAMGGFSVPVFGILWGGFRFHFFKFDGVPKVPHSFLRGALPGDPRMFQHGFALPDLNTPDESALAFMRVIRLVSEIIFDLFLSSYISSIEAFCNRSVTRSTKEGTCKSLSKWEDALSSAKWALNHFREGECKRGLKDKASANESTSQGRMLLEHSAEAIPLVDSRDFLLMSCWNDDAIELA
ncbi:hypothetical protein AX17_004817 [Amanita inopinata Kibby_2008]|nr:hypothetical protein AX17_004817 [Amanita inopinata Kibby_2008]